MTSTRILPHLVPHHGWAFSEWKVRVNGLEQRADEPASLWDYDAELSVSYSLRLEVDEILETVGLGSDAVLAAYILADCRQGQVRRSTSTPANDSGEVHLELTIEPGILASQVTLHRGVVVQEPGVGPSSILSPVHTGSRLVEDEPFPVILEGEGSRFPVETLDFDQVGLQGAWLLDVDPGADAEDPFLGVARLLLNESHPAVQLLSSRPPDELVPLVLNALGSDSLRMMIQYAASDETYAEPAVFPDESLGHVLHSAGENELGEPLPHLIRLLHDEPQRFEQILQGRTKYLVDIPQRPRETATTSDGDR